MKFYNEPQKQVPIIEEVDILVIGGGPAGFSAAINAAREGAKTMLIEQAGQVGGVSTIGLMSHWTGKTVGGFYEEILNRTEPITEKVADMGIHGSPRQVINPERLKLVMLEMLQEAGVILRLYTFACDVIMDATTVRGVITESKSGREAILSKITIDASGDGDIAAMAGAKYYKGREYDGRMQPMTIMIKVAGVDTSRVTYIPGFDDTCTIPAGDLQTEARKNIPFPAGHVLLYPTDLPGVVTCNMTNCINVDGTKSEDLTRAEITCRGQIQPIIKFLQEYVPGFENCYVMSTSSAIGVRETRHFIGESTLSEQDIMTAKTYDDWAVAKVQFNFDVHNLSGAGLDKTGNHSKLTQTQFYTIPYGCFIPKEIDNLMLAGRNISGTHMAHSSYRVMPICSNMGQSVGIAAALCCKEGVLPRRLNVKLLQNRLLELGVSP